jgi:GAF domain-containing protein
MANESLKIAELKKQLEESRQEVSRRDAEIAIIKTIQDGLINHFNIHEMYFMVGEKIREIFSAQVLDIVAFDSDRNIIEDKYAFEKGDRTLLGPRQVSGFRKIVIDTKKVLLLNSNVVQAVKDYGVDILIGDIPKSAVFVPMLVSGDVKGIISLQNPEQENAFSDSDVNFLNTLANSLSVALENGRLMDESQRLLKITEERAQELAILNSVGEAMSKTLDINTVTHIVGEKVRSIFSADVTEILLYDEASRMIHVPYAFAGDYQEVEPFPLGTGVTSKVVLSGKPVLTHNIEEAIALGALIPKEEDRTESCMFVPISASERMLGVVSVQCYRKNAYDEADVRLLGTLSSSMGIALENARLFDETNRLLKETKQRTAELAVINSVQDGLAKELDIQGIYQLVGEKMREIFNAQVIDIVTYDATHHLIEDKYAYEKGDTTLLGPREPKGFRKHVIDTGELLLVNKDSEKIRQKYDNSVLIGEGSKSAIFVPLLSGGKVSGIISLQNLDVENAFTDSDVNLLTTLANSMNVALESARLFNETNRLLKETEQRNAELAVINSVQESLVAKIEIADIYELVGEKIREIFDAQVIDIVTYNASTHQIEDKYAYEKGDRTMLGPREVSGFRKHVIETKQVLLHNANVAQAMKDFGNEILIGEVPKSQVYVPMIVAGEVKGIISLQNLDHENVFSESDVNLITTLANSMTVALESARLFDETTRLLNQTEQRTRELSVINSVQEGLAKELDMNGIYELVGEKMREIFNAQVFDIATYDKQTKLVTDRYNYELGDRTMLPPRPLIGFRKWVIENNQPLMINRNIDVVSRELGNMVMTGEDTKSVVFVPILVGGESVGVMSLQHVNEDAFTDADVRLLTTLGNSMSVALENARLFDETNRLLKETEQRTAELAVINSVQEGLASELDIQGIYELVGDRLCQLFPETQTLVIRTFDHQAGVEHFHYAIEKGVRFPIDSRAIYMGKQIPHSK